MKKLDFKEIKLTKEMEEGLKSQELDITKAISVLFTQAVEKKYAQGAPVEVTRKYMKVLDAIDGSLEFEDEDFKFLKEIYDTGTFPLNAVVPLVADYLSTVK